MLMASIVVLVAVPSAVSAQAIESIRIVEGTSVYCIKAPAAKNADGVSRLLAQYATQGKLGAFPKLRLSSSTTGRPPCTAEEYEAVPIR